MSIADEITKAVGAHAQWKQRLRSAIDTGKSDFDPAKVKTDNNCDFGKWLYSLDAEKNSTDWKNIQALHADFHKEAGQILDTALKGNKVAANAALDLGKPFTSISSKLTSALMAWKNKAG